MQKLNTVAKIVIGLLTLSVISLLVLSLLAIWECKTDVAAKICGSLFTITFFFFIAALMAGKMPDPSDY